MDNISESLQKKLDAIVIIIDNEIIKCNEKIENMSPIHDANASINTHFPNFFTVKSPESLTQLDQSSVFFHYAWREQYCFVKSLLINHHFSSIALLIAGGRIKIGDESRSLAIPVREKIASITGDLLAAVQPVITECESIQSHPRSIRRRM